MKENRVVNAKESILSKTPPCHCPISLIPMSRFIADTTTSPTKPTPAMKKLTTITCRRLMELKSSLDSR